MTHTTGADFYDCPTIPKKRKQGIIITRQLKNQEEEISGFWAFFIY
jgi:hypothetical protein